MSIKKEKKAMSEVVAALLMVVLVVVLVAIVWGVINNIVNKNIRGAEACVGNFDKLSINDAYTCYNLTNKELYFSLSLGEVSMDHVFVSIGSEGSITSIILNSTEQTLSNVFNYPSGSSGVIAPPRNSGRTYIYHGLDSAPDLISVALVIGGERCPESDSVVNVERCFSF